MHSPLQSYCSCHLCAVSSKWGAALQMPPLPDRWRHPLSPHSCKCSCLFKGCLFAAAAGFTCRCVGQVEGEHAGVEVAGVIAADRLDGVHADLGRSSTQLPIHVRGGPALGKELACPCQLEYLHRAGSVVMESLGGISMAAEGAPWPAQKQAAGASPS